MSADRILAFSLTESYSFGANLMHILTRSLSIETADLKRSAVVALSILLVSLCFGYSERNVSGRLVLCLANVCLLARNGLVNVVEFLMPISKDK